MFYVKAYLGVDFGQFPIYQLMLCVGFVVGLLVFNGAAKRLSASTYIKRRMRFSLFIGASVVDVTAHGRIADAQAALAVINACDNWAALTYDEGKTLTLPTGNKAYVFNQTVEGKAVLGKTQMLVTDAADNALYVVGDAATMTFGEETSPAPMARAKMDPIGTGLDWVLEQHDLENARTAVELISAIVGGWDKFFEFLMDETGSDLGDQVKESYRSEYEKRAAEAEKKQKILAAWIEEEMKK